MKIILSRKSMDKQYGGIPSPILMTKTGNQKFYPLPIPISPDQSSVKYSDLNFVDNFSVRDFIKDVAPNYIQSEYCHLDPDLREAYLPDRPKEWQRAFGQVSTAQSHLERNLVKEGDIFLFFGWFQFAENVNGKFRFVKDKKYPNGFHSIYGYLQVDKIYKPNIEITPNWLSKHAHVENKGKRNFDKLNNTVYVAKDKFQYKKDQFNKNGAIGFTFNEDLILTQSGNRNRTVWELPKIFHPDNGVELSYNPKKNWSIENNKIILNSASRGQEFVFRTDPKGQVEKWAINLIKHNTVTD